MQSKFLNLVEDNTPDDSIDRNTKAKLTVLRALIKASSEKVKFKNKQHTNVFFFTDEEGGEYKVSIDNVGVEDEQMNQMDKQVDVVKIAAAAGEDDMDVKKAETELNNKLVQRLKELRDQIR